MPHSESSSYYREEYTRQQFRKKEKIDHASRRAIYRLIDSFPEFLDFEALERFLQEKISDTSIVEAIIKVLQEKSLMGEDFYHPICQKVTNPKRNSEFISFIQMYQLQSLCEKDEWGEPIWCTERKMLQLQSAIVANLN